MREHYFYQIEFEYQIQGVHGREIESSKLYVACTSFSEAEKTAEQWFAKENQGRKAYSKDERDYKIVDIKRYGYAFVV